MKIYTKKGDKGETALYGGARVKKTHKRIEAYGTLDELNAHLGLVLSELHRDLKLKTETRAFQQQLLTIQNELFSLGAELATPADKKSKLKNPITDKNILALETAIDEMDKELPPLTAFILPGGVVSSSMLHVARTVCRRAERLMVGFTFSDDSHISGENCRDECMAYVNRLSDYLFTAARFVNLKSGQPDIAWEN